MISSRQILTVGPEYTPPKGGVAQCVATCGNRVFTGFRTLTNSCEGSSFKKMIKALTSFFHFCFLLFVDREIKVVHIHTASYNSFKRSAYFVKAAKLLNRKVIIHIHGGSFKEYYEHNRSFVDSLMEKCDALITLSPSWKSFFENTVGHKNVFVVPNIIDCPKKKDVETDGRFHLLFMGHIYQAKGIFDLVEVIKDYHSEYRNRLILDIGGAMYDVEFLKQFILENKLEDIIHFHGWVSGDKKIELLNLADAFILPSYAEGVPISILEAESYGLPILSTFVGGIPEVVENGKNGYLFNPGDKNTMKKCIDLLMTNKSLQIEMGRKSVLKSIDNLPLAVEAKLKAVYSSLKY